MSFTLVIPLYLAGTVIAMFIAPARGYWWPFGLLAGLLTGPIAPVVMFVLPNRKRKPGAP